MPEATVITTSKKDTSGYQSIFKATSLFGGVQIVNILISIVKQKFVAVLLGPAGMGISGLYTSATSLIQGLTAMGLSSSAVKNVAEANGTGDQFRISRIVTVLQKLVWITGLLGTVFVIALSPYLSVTTFGNYDYTVQFVFLSVSLLFQQLSSGQRVVLQGLRRFKDLAKASVLGSFFGLILSVPLYYFFGIGGIVPTILLTSVVMLLLTWHFSRKVKVDRQKVSIKETFKEGKEMLKMGLVMSLNSILVLGVAYIIRIFIIRVGGAEDVGFYTAGFAIVTGYVGLVFTAMSTDFYPRLAAVNTDNEKCREIVNQQAEIALLILTPILLLFLIFAPLAIRVLYSSRFLPIVGFMQWAILGMLFKAASWSISFQFIAKQDMRVFAINEIVTNAYFLGFNLLGYYLFGLDGLGIAFTLSFLIYLVQVFIVTHARYHFTFTRAFKKLFLIELTLLITCFLSFLLDVSFYAYVTAGVATFVCILYSFHELDKRVFLKQKLINGLKRRS